MDTLVESTETTSTYPSQLVRYSFFFHHQPSTIITWVCVPLPGCQSLPEMTLHARSGRSIKIMDQLPSLKPTVRTCQESFPKGKIAPSNPKWFRCELLVSRSVDHEMLLFIYDIPGTQMTSIFEGQPPKTRPFSNQNKGPFYMFNLGDSNQLYRLLWTRNDVGFAGLCTWNHLSWMFCLRWFFYGLHFKEYLFNFFPGIKKANPGSCFFSLFFFQVPFWLSQRPTFKLLGTTYFLGQIWRF